MFLLLAALSVFVYGGMGIDYGYTHIGCFVDKADRAMPYLGLYLIDPIRHCAERAKKDGFTTFGVQFGTQCYGGPEAANTYNKYGSSDGCSKGVGGSYANDVYQYEDFGHIGCFKDDGDYRAFPTYLGDFPADKVIEKCAAEAKAKHFPIFAVQYEVECWTGPKAEQDYDKYGVGTGCKDGRGGSLLNDVYSFTTYHSVGCFQDNIIIRAIALPFLEFHTIYPTSTAVANCADHAKSKHAIGFGVQYDLFGRQCYYIRDSSIKYDKYGKATGCKGGVGGLVQNDVYLFY